MWKTRRLLSENLFFHLGNVYFKNGIRLHHDLHLIVRGHDGCVIAVEDLGDIREGHIDQIADEEDGNVTCVCDLLVSLGADQILLGDAVFSEHCSKDLIDRDVDRLGSAEQLNSFSCAPP